MMMTTKANSVDLIEHMGSDLTVVNAARVSFHKHTEAFESGDEKLIKYLAKHDHWTPFSHPQITLREKVPIFVARQRFKHMVGFTYNEVSRRYVDSDIEIYVPEEWRSKPEGTIKQGSGGVHPDTDVYTRLYQKTITDNYFAYLTMIEEGVAPEMARMVLPQSMMTEYYVTGSLAAYARAYTQRIYTGAQKEIQQLAVEWSKIIEPLFPVSWKCLVEEASAHD
jgi:thymidylate synthase (FAD)